MILPQSRDGYTADQRVITGIDDNLAALNADVAVLRELAHQLVATNATPGAKQSFAELERAINDRREQLAGLLMRHESNGEHLLLS